MRDSAHRYAKRGWPVLPVEPGGKKPAGRLVPHGLHEATVDRELIERWWREEPDANIGLLTGVRFDVLDSDGEEARAAFPPELRSDEPPILGPTVVSARGPHCYVAPSGRGSRKLAPSLDYKGRNGYVLAPPSVHPSGAVYRWYAGEDDPDRGIDAPILPPPPFLLVLLHGQPDRAITASPKGPPRRRPPKGRLAYGTRALLSEVLRVAMAPEGDRNNTLHRAAFRMGQLIPDGTVDVEAARDTLVLIAERIGLPGIEAENTIASGLRAGASNPRGL